MNKFWGNRRVLITGHTGFKGTWLTYWLVLLGAKVIGIFDLSGDNFWNVFDIVFLVNCILAENCSSNPNACAGDFNNDGNWDVLDIVHLVNCVLANNCGN